MEKNKILELVTKIIEQPSKFTKEEADELIKQSSLEEISEIVHTYLVNFTIDQAKNKIPMGEFVAFLLTKYEEAIFFNVVMSTILTSEEMMKVIENRTGFPNNVESSLSRLKAYNDIPA